MPYTYAYPRPAVTADVVVFTVRADHLAVLLVRRKGEPFKGHWALPGGFVSENESLAKAAARELHEETGLVVSPKKLEMVGAFGDPGRDPRGHTVSVAYATVRATEGNLRPGDDASEATWYPLRDLDLGRAAEPHAPSQTRRARAKGSRGASSQPLSLAFDHAAIVRRAYRRICRHLDDPVRDPAFDFVPSRFTLTELRRIYEVVLGERIAPRMIRQHLIDRGLIVAATSRPTAKASSQLYRWNKR